METEEGNSEVLIKEVLDHFLEKDLYIRCPGKEKRVCKDGSCLGRMSFKWNTYHLATGINLKGESLSRFAFKLNKAENISALELETDGPAKIIGCFRCRGLLIKMNLQLY
jgi:hypothetical protein